MIQSLERAHIHWKGQFNTIRPKLVAESAVKQPSDDKLKLANSSWKTQVCVCERTQQQLVNCWREQLARSNLSMTSMIDNR